MTISKKIAISCAVGLSIFLLALGLMYRLLHVNHKNFYNSGQMFISEEMPDFNLPILGGLDSFVDQNFFKNKVTLMSIWSTNCRTCRHEHAALLNIAKYLKDKDVHFVGLNCSNNQEQAIEWLNRNGDPYSINLFDPKSVLVAELGSTGLPDFLIIDSYNKIQYRYSGTITNNVWEKNIRPVLDGLYLHTNK